MLYELSPEIIISLAAIAVLLLDLFVEDKRPLSYLSILGASASLVASYSLFNAAPAQLFNGMFILDGFAFFFKLMFLIVVLLVCLASISYIERSHGEYYSLILFSTLGMMLVASSGDFILLYVGLETAGIASYALAGFWKNKRSSEGAMKYFVMGALSSALVLFGLSLLYGIAGTTNIAMSMHLMSEMLQSYYPAAILALVFLAAGFGFKIAAVPFHMWAPDAYQGSPATIAALLSSASKKMGFAAAFKIFALSLIAMRFELSVVFALLALATMTLGNVVALSQRNIMRMLAYSSIAQAGYILIALSILTPLGFVAGFFHAFTHAFMSAGAFIATALVAQRTTGENIEDYIGLSKRAPITAFALMIFLLSLIGIPPLVGFWSKVLILAAALDAGTLVALLLATALILNSALSVFYYARVIKYMYIVKPEQEKPRIQESTPFVLALVVAALAILVMGVLPERFIELAVSAALDLLAE